MGASTKELRQRIDGVSNIQKITGAMEMVATTKLRRLQQRAEGTRPYADTIQKLSGNLAASASQSFELSEGRDQIKRRGILLISSDRGLCGSYNANVFRVLNQHLDTHPDIEPVLYILGRKGVQHYSRRLPIQTSYDDVVEKLDYRRVRDIARQLAEAFIAGGAGDGVDDVWVVSTRFISVGRQVPMAEQLLPIMRDADAGEGAPESGGEMLMEPSADELLRRLLPKALEVRLFAAILDSLASEFAMKRMAMKAATDAAGDMIQDLRRRYNRARQETITKELLDIVGGAEALN